MAIVARSRIAELIAKVASGVFLIGIAGAVIALFGQVYLARILGPEEYGWYVLMLAWMQILTVPAVLGFDTVALRFTATYTAVRKWAELRGLLQFSIPVVLGIATTIAAVALMVNGWFQLLDEPQRRGSLAVAMCLLLVMAVTPVLDGVLRGLKKVVYSSFAINIVRPLLLLCAVFLCVTFYKIEIRSFDALILNLVAAGLVAVVLVYFVRRFIPEDVFAAAPSYESKTWFAVALPMLLMSGMQILLQRVDVLMLGALLDPAQAGIYAASGRIAAVVGFGLASVNSIATPMLAEYFEKRDFSNIQTVLTWSARIAALVAVPMVMVLYVFGEHLLALFGEEFIVGQSALQILLIGSVVNATVSSVGFALVMGGQQNKAAAIMAVAVLVNVALNVLLIPRYGIQGAATATVICMIFWKFSMFVVVRSLWGVNASVFSRPST